MFYVSPMVTTKKTPTEDNPKENEKGIKACYQKKNQYNIKEDSKRRKDGQKSYKT